MGVQVEEEKVSDNSEWACRRGPLRVDKPGTLSDSCSLFLSLSPSLCGQLMSLKASPLHLSAQNQMNPLK